MNLPNSFDHVRTVAVVCTQWGDTGKGKLVDLLGDWADIIARGTGGANAGHTIVSEGKKFVFHLLPSGILRDALGKRTVIGSGVAFDPRIACEELAMLEAHGLTFGNLSIAWNAKLVLPQHILLDRLTNSGRGTIGTTGRGIGPAYVDHVARTGLTVNDLLNADTLARKLRRNLREKALLIRAADPNAVAQILQHPHLEKGIYQTGDHGLDPDAIIEQYLAYGSRLRPMICDTDALMREAAGKQRILLEGAQGLLLSIDYGTYPFVTSSDASAQGLAKGVGLDSRSIDVVLGVAKAYLTRVGEGPFPTEFGEDSAKWCATPGLTGEAEREQFPDASVNSSNPFEQGVALRRLGGEYGATTGRPRRTGWFDLPLLRYAAPILGRRIALTKLDVLGAFATIRVCDAYRYQGPTYSIGASILRRGSILSVAVPDTEVLAHCEPIYSELPGWECDLGGAATRADLPANARRFLEYIEREAGVTIDLISTGAERNQTIWSM